MKATQTYERDVLFYLLFTYLLNLLSYLTTHSMALQALGYTAALFTEMYAKRLRIFEYRRTVTYFTVNSVQLAQHNRRRLQEIFPAAVDNQVTNT